MSRKAKPEKGSKRSKGAGGRIIESADKSASALLARANNNTSDLSDLKKSKNKFDMRTVYIIIAVVFFVVLLLLAIIFKNKLTGKDEEIKTLQKSIKTKSLTYSEELEAVKEERSRIEEEMKTATSEVKEELEAQLSDLESQLSASELELEEAESNLAKLTTENAGLLDSLSEYLNSNVDSTPESEIIQNVRTRAEKIAGELCDCFTKQGGWDVDAGVTLLNLDDFLVHGTSDESLPPAPPASPDNTAAVLTPIYEPSGGDPTTGTIDMTHHTGPEEHNFNSMKKTSSHEKYRQYRQREKKQSEEVVLDMTHHTGPEEHNFNSMKKTSSHEKYRQYRQREKKQSEEVVLNILRSTTWGQKLQVDYNKDLADFTSQEQREAQPILQQKQKAFRKCFFNTLATELDNFKNTEPSDYKTGIFISELGAAMLRTKCTRSILTNIKYGHTLQLLVDAAEKQVDIIDNYDSEDSNPDAPPEEEDDTADTVLDLTDARTFQDDPTLYDKQAPVNDMSFVYDLRGRKWSDCGHYTREWWGVDLGSKVYVSKIILQGRYNCCPKRLRGVEIYLGSVKGTYVGNTNVKDNVSVDPKKSLKVSINASGRYLYLRRPHRPTQNSPDNGLTICKIYVFSK